MIKLALENLFSVNNLKQTSVSILPQSKTLGTESASNQTVDIP